MHRRTYLRSLAAATAVGLAGCSGSSDRPTPDSTATATAASTTTPTTRRTTDTPPETIEEFWDPDRFEKLRHGWLRSHAYEDVLWMLDEEETLVGDLGDGRSNVPFPNRNRDERDPGHWDPDAFRQETDVERILWWANAAAMSFHYQHGDGAVRYQAKQFASTVELVVNEYHPEATVTSGFTDAPGITGTGHDFVENVGVIYSPLENVAGEFHWWSIRYYGPRLSPMPRSAFAPGGAEFDGEQTEQYHPFAQGYPNHDIELGFDQTPSAHEGLVGLVKPDNPRLERESPYRIEDDWMTQAYEWITNDGEIDPILEPLQKGAYAIESNMTPWHDRSCWIRGDLDDPKVSIES